MWQTDDAADLYGVERWGEGYFAVNRNGNLEVRPTREDGKSVEVLAVLKELEAKGITTPIIFRFPQILEDRVRVLTESFQSAIREYGYQAPAILVYPMKVNQRKEIVADVVAHGAKFKYGLEVGSKPELISAVAMDPSPETVLVCNGFKDEQFVRLATHATMLNKRVIVVIDKLDETQLLIKVIKDLGISPDIGIRVKLVAKGGGKWAESSGERAKFGLTIPEIVRAVSEFREAGLLDRVKMIHFHIGSQVNDVKRIYGSVREGGRIYAKMRKLGVPLEIIDVGGGIGVDYDGSKTASPTSLNYTLQEYANTVVYTLKQVCDEEKVPHPAVLSESGRAVVAYQTLLVMNLFKKIPSEFGAEEGAPKPGDPPTIQELASILAEMNGKNYIEYYHDAVQRREELTDMFSLGFLDLEARSRGEILFRHVAEKVFRFASQEEDPDDVPEEVEDLKKRLQTKFIANFSLFQSTPDIWGVKQLFPVMPIHRMEKKPTQYGTIVDITCDSDGEIKRFVDVYDNKDTLELHELNGGAYYVAVMLVGAYQDSMGDFHNLFGRVHEVHVTVGPDGTHKVERLIPGDSVGEVLAYVNYSGAELKERMQTTVAAMVKRRGITRAKAEAVMQEFTTTLEGYTYLAPQQFDLPAKPEKAERPERNGKGERKEPATLERKA